MKLARHAIADNEAGPVTRPLAVFDCSSNNTAQTGAVTFSERECTIELEGRNSKLRIHWKGATLRDGRPQRGGAGHRRAPGRLPAAGPLEGQEPGCRGIGEAWTVIVLGRETSSLHFGYGIPRINEAGAARRGMESL